MRQIVLIVGVENQEALETAAWYLKRGDAVYAGVTNGDEALKERLEETYPGLHVNQLDLGTEEPAALAEQIMQAEKKLDVLVLQAGGARSTMGRSAAKTANIMTTMTCSGFWTII